MPGQGRRRSPAEIMFVCRNFQLARIHDVAHLPAPFQDASNGMSGAGRPCRCARSGANVAVDGRV
jgi:hypothetical protein